MESSDAIFFRENDQSERAMNRRSSQSFLSGSSSGEWARNRVRIIVAGLGVSLAALTAPIAADAQSTRSATRVVEPGESIQAAIDASAAGTQIRVKAGTYREQLVITKDGISLDGDAGARLIPPATLVANGCTGIAVLGRVATAPPAHAGICVIGDVVFGAWDAVVQHKPVTETKRAVSDVRVTGFDVEGFQVGIALAGTPRALLAKNYIVAGGPFAVVTSAAPDSVVRGNQMINPAATPSVIGICLEGSDRSSITRNEISGFINGICLASSHILVGGNQLFDNHVGLYIDPGYEDIEVRHNVITRNNRIEPAAPNLRTGTGIAIEAARNVRVFGNEITGNTSDNIARGLPIGAAGVVVRDTSPTVVASNISVRLNNITGNGLDPAGVPYPGAFDVIVISAGSGITIEHNRCTSSRPAGLCE